MFWSFRPSGIELFACFKSGGWDWFCTGFVNMRCMHVHAPVPHVFFLLPVWTCIVFVLLFGIALARLLSQAFYSKWLSSRIKVCAPGARKTYEVTDMSVFRKEESYVDFFQTGEFVTLDELIEDAGHDANGWSLRNKVLFVTQAEGMFLFA